jgi:NCS1 family nucleobase:cation symporter-1
LICDYWVIRRQELSLKDLFLENGLYSYTNGINWRAVAAFIVGVAPVVPGFLRAATTPGGTIENPNYSDTIYTYSWFVTFGLSFFTYLLLMRPREKNRGV